MTDDCPSCGGPIKSGDWTCGRCGAPAAGAGGGPTAAGTQGSGYGAQTDASPYLPEYQPQPATAGAAAAARAPTTSSGSLRLVIIIAVVALLAIFAVWFFVVRGPKTSGDEFLGTWTATTQQGIATVAVTRPEDAFKVTIAGGQSGQQVTVPAHIDGKELVITIDDFATLAGEANADRLKDALKALAGDFRLTFSSVDATHLSLLISGTSPAGEKTDTTSTLVKATP